MNVTLDDMIACAKRELAMRQRVYPKWVAASRMKAAAAEHELSVMSAIVAKLVAEKETTT